MRRLCLALALAWGCASGAAMAADRPERLVMPPPMLKTIASMPQIADPADAAERRINAALKRLDQAVVKAARACKGGDWQRSVDAPMRGPGFLSLAITDSWYCADAAHPDAATFSIVYDLVTGRPVDWTRLLPPSLTGTVALEEQADGSKIVTLASRRLFDLYLAGYGTGEDKRDDLDECKQAFKDLAGDGPPGKDLAGDGPPGMMVWLDAKGGGLAVQVGLPHVVQACEEPVVIPAAVLRLEGAQPALLRAFEAGR